MPRINPRRLAALLLAATLLCASLAKNNPETHREKGRELRLDAAGGGEYRALTETVSPACCFT